MAEEFILPDFLSNCDTDVMHQKMMDALPEDIDDTEGGFPWDFTRPTAEIAAELIQYYLVNAIKLVFPKWSNGIYLDYIAAMAQVTRREATKATAVLHLAGVPGTIINAGTVFATESVDDAESIEFSADTSYVLDSDGEADINVTAVIAGIGSNVHPGTIVLMSTPISGIETVNNPLKATGGTDQEDDDSLRERVESAEQENDISYIGNDSDYKRWAESVSGVGRAIVIPEWMGKGTETVKIVCIDANGEPANETITTNVYNYIMSPDNPMERIAPPNVILTVSSPDMVSVSYTATVTLADGYSIQSVKEAFENALDKDYYPSVTEQGMVRYNMVCSILTGIPGISDFTGMAMNSCTANIMIEADEYPSTLSVEFTDASEVV